ncbi:hypothetical protein C1645_788353 [Glomus cerebriforme]|uniref:Uncharacterized protein n=1 Tax=Glomus cerebriforme TaxID=658196 RepID=A0A397SI19_9GLOM|nr:hypothetical protein C1645_788353 [Glomus cerebriforme]
MMRNRKKTKDIVLVVLINNYHNASQIVPRQSDFILPAGIVPGTKYTVIPWLLHRINALSQEPLRSSDYKLSGNELEFYPLEGFDLAMKFRKLDWRLCSIKDKKSRNSRIIFSHGRLVRTDNQFNGPSSFKRNSHMDFSRIEDLISDVDRSFYAFFAICQIKTSQSLYTYKVDLLGELKTDSDGKSLISLRIMLKN